MPPWTVVTRKRSPRSYFPHECLPLDGSHDHKSSPARLLLWQEQHHDDTCATAHQTERRLLGKSQTFRRKTPNSPIRSKTVGPHPPSCCPMSQKNDRQIPRNKAMFHRAPPPRTSYRTLHPSRKMALVRTVAEVVPSPATSLVLEATYQPQITPKSTVSVRTRRRAWSGTKIAGRNRRQLRGSRLTDFPCVRHVPRGFPKGLSNG